MENQTCSAFSVQSSVNLIDKSNICHQIRFKYGTLILLKEEFSSWNLENIPVKLNL